MTFNAAKMFFDAAAGISRGAGRALTLVVVVVIEQVRRQD
jgi:hypothetical protein